MAASEAALVNLALRHLGDSTRIVDLSTETSKAAKAGREFLPIALDTTFRARDWSFLRAEATLDLVETVADGDFRADWRYAFRLPNDCLVARRLTYGWRNPPLAHTLPFEVRLPDADAAWSASVSYVAGACASVTTGPSTVWYRALATTLNEAPAATPAAWQALAGLPPQLLYTTFHQARLRYTRTLSDVRRLPLELDNAVAYYLAYLLGPHMSDGDSAMADRAGAAWGAMIRAAEANDAAQRQKDVEPPSEFELARVTES